MLVYQRVIVFGRVMGLGLERAQLPAIRRGGKSPGATTFTSHQHDAQKWPWHFGGGNWIRWF